MNCVGQVFLALKKGICSQSKMLSDLVLESVFLQKERQNPRNLEKENVSFNYSITTSVCLPLFNDLILQNFLYFILKVILCMVCGVSLLTALVSEITSMDYSEEK